MYQLTSFFVVVNHILNYLRELCTENLLRTPEILQLIVWVPGWILVLDSLVKISSYGWKTYWRNNLNRFDFIFAVLVVTVDIAAFLQLVGHQWYAT